VLSREWAAISSRVERAVWSYWSKPMDSGFGNPWTGARHHLLSWVLSFEVARKHFRTTALVTDDAGAALLIEQLGLDFDEVSTELNDLADADPGWWVLGKLLAYERQHEPFVHVDSDVYLWSPLPNRLLTARVLAQNPEVIVPGSSTYEPEVLEQALACDGWLPREWVTIRKSPRTTYEGACCGIVGGIDVEFLRYYSQQAIEILSHPSNAFRLSQLANKSGHVILVEQFFLWACVEYYRYEPSSPFFNVELEYLFKTEKQSYEGAGPSAFTHLIGPAKKNRLIARRLETRVRRQFPERAAQVDRLTRAERIPLGGK
jgi:hypothetical protein